MIIYHRTDVDTAFKIVISKQIWSKDGYGQANFHTEKYGGGSQCKNELTLAFEWKGKVLENEPKKWPGKKNILYCVPWAGDTDRLWSMVLFKGTDENLFFIGLDKIEIPVDEEKKNKEETIRFINSKLKAPLAIKVPEEINRVNVTSDSSNKGALLKKIERLFGRLRQ